MVLEYFKGDVCDRFSILTLKKERLPENEDIDGEYKLIKKEFDKLARGVTGLKIKPLYFKLYNCNRIIWDLESDIRKGLDNRLTLEEVGKRAISIRDWNRDRVLIKNEINKLFNEFGDVKIDHASELKLSEKAIEELIEIKEQVDTSLFNKEKYSTEYKNQLKKDLREKRIGRLY